MLHRHICPQIVEPQAVVERQPLERPLILNEEPEVGHQPLFLQVRRGKLRDLVWHAPQERVRHIALDLRTSIGNAFLNLYARSEGMGAGDVRHGEPLYVAVVVQYVVV